MKVRGLGAMLGVLLLSAGSGAASAALPTPHPPRLVHFVGGPPSVGPPQWVDALAPLPPDNAAALIGYENPPGSGRLWWLNLATRRWTPGPVLGEGGLAPLGSRVVFCGTVEGRPSIILVDRPKMGRGVARPLALVPAWATSLTAPTTYDGTVYVGVNGSGRSELWALTKRGLQFHWRVAGRVTAVAAGPGGVAWVAEGPSGLTVRSPDGQTRHWALPAVPTAVALLQQRVVALLHQPTDPVGAASLMAVVNDGRLTYAGTPDPLFPGWRAPWAGAFTAVAPARSDAVWGVSYRIEPAELLVTRLSLPWGPTTYLGGVRRANRLSVLPPNFPLVVTARRVLVGIGNHILIANRPAPTVAPGP